MSEYADLLQDAIDSLHAVLKETEPGTGLGLHQAYNTLKGSLVKAQRQEEQQDEHRQEQPFRRYGPTDEEMARFRSWERHEQHHRQRLVIEALGAEGLTVRELADRLETPDMVMSYTRLYPLLTKIMEPAGEVRRTVEPWRGTKTITRWYRNTKLEGPIAELQRALDEDA